MDRLLHLRDVGKSGDSTRVGVRRGPPATPQVGGVAGVVVMSLLHFMVGGICARRGPPATPQVGGVCARCLRLQRTACYTSGRWRRCYVAATLHGRRWLRSQRTACYTSGRRCRCYTQGRRCRRLQWIACCPAFTRQEMVIFSSSPFSSLVSFVVDSDSSSVAFGLRRSRLLVSSSRLVFSSRLLVFFTASASVQVSLAVTAATA